MLTLKVTMKIILITFVTPASENIRGTSALPYHLIKGSLSLSLPRRKGDLDVNGNDNVDSSHAIAVYSFNSNKLSDEKIQEVEKELGVTIKKIPLPKWYQWIFKLHLLFLRIILKYPFANYIVLSKQYIQEIEAKNPDLIWVMGEELSRIVKQFPKYQRIQIGPDTESLYYYRLMGCRFVMKNALNYWKCALMYRKYARMERAFCTDDSFTYYAVGEEDVRHLQQLNPKVKAKFLRHPHYEVSNLSPILSRREGAFHQPKIKLLIAGQYNHYMKQDGDLLIKSLTPAPSPKEKGIEDFLQKHYSFTFLGKGWEKHVVTLRSVGYEVEHIRFAPDYIEEICKHDIQITPISIGTGTKGKVLDALANGLLVIGTPYALENIAVKHGESCIEYRHPQEVIEVLKDIPNNIHKYEMMAAEGQRQVLAQHDRAFISSQLFNLIKQC